MAVVGGVPQAQVHGRELRSGPVTSTTHIFEFSFFFKSSMTQEGAEEAPLLDTLDIVIITAVLAVALWLLGKRVVAAVAPKKAPSRPATPARSRRKFATWQHVDQRVAHHARHIARPRALFAHYACICTCFTHAVQADHRHRKAARRHTPRTTLLAR